MTNNHIVLTSLFGSTGDVAYLAGIAKELTRAGYRTQMMVPKFVLSDTRDLLESMGLQDIVCVDPSTPTPRELLGYKLHEKSILARFHVIKGIRRKQWRETMNSVRELLHRAGGIQLIIGDASSFLLIGIALSAGIPYVQASPMPYVPTRQFFLGSRYPCVGKFSSFNLFRWNVRQYRLSRFATRRTRVFGKEVAPEYQWRREAIDPKSWRHYYRNTLCHLVSASPVIIPKPADWGPNVRCLGYTPWKTQPWKPAPQLAEFVEAGPPPIYLGFGSYTKARFMGEFGKKLLLELAHAARAQGERLVFQSAGTALAGESDLPDNLCCADYVSHEWLFPKCRAVICHGGYGTLHSALVAKKPLVIYPFQTDQFMLAKRMEQLGVSLPFRTTYKGLTARTFVRDLRELRGAALLEQNSERVGDLILGEDGPGNHRSAIQEYLQNRRTVQ